MLAQQVILSPRTLNSFNLCFEKNRCWELTSVGLQLQATIGVLTAQQTQAMGTGNTALASARPSMLAEKRILETSGALRRRWRTWRLTRGSSTTGRPSTPSSTRWRHRRLNPCTQGTAPHKTACSPIRWFLFSSTRRLPRFQHLYLILIEEIPTGPSVRKSCRGQLDAAVL